MELSYLRARKILKTLRELAKPENQTKSVSLELLIIVSAVP